MRCLLEWFRADKIADFRVFSDAPLFLDASETCYRPPTACYLDEPLQQTGLEAVFEGDSERFSLSRGYIKHFGARRRTFAEKAGVLAALPFRQVHTTSGHPDSSSLLKHFGRRRTENEVDRDWVIDRLPDLLAKRDLSISKVVWDGMGRAHPSVLQACYQPNAQYSLQTAPSSLVYTKEHRLGSDKDGSFHRPRDVTEETLADGWPVNGSNGWLTAVEFGVAGDNRSVEQQLRAEAAEHLGISPALAEELQALSQPAQQELLERIRESKVVPSVQFPSDDHGGATDTRFKRAVEVALDAPKISREPREKCTGRFSKERGKDLPC